MKPQVAAWLKESGNLPEYIKIMNNPVMVKVLELLERDNRPSLGFGLTPGLSSDFKLGYVAGKSDLLYYLKDLIEPETIVEETKSTYEDMLY